MDILSKEQRSRVMSRIHGSGTKPELFVRKGLFARGFRYRVNSSGLPGRPDLKLTGCNAVIFVHGCFWHGHACGLFRPPVSNVGYWGAKIERNRERDLEALTALRDAGWRVCVVWECAIKRAAADQESDSLLDRIASWLQSSGSFIEFSGSEKSIKRNRSAAAYAAERSARYGRG